MQRQDAPRVYNLGGDERISLKMMKECFQDYFKPQELKFEEIQAPEFEILESFADCTKANEELNWKSYLEGHNFKKEMRSILEDEFKYNGG